MGNPSDPKTLHKYLYSNGDPVNMEDPSGRGALDYFMLNATLVVYAVAQNPQGALLMLSAAGCFPIEITNLYLKWAAAVNRDTSEDNHNVPEPPAPIPDIVEQAHQWCEFHQLE